MEIGEVINNGPILDDSTPLVDANHIAAKEEAEQEAAKLLQDVTRNTTDIDVMNPVGITVRISGDRHPTTEDVYREQVNSHAVIVGGRNFQDGAILDDQNPKPLRGDNPNLLIVTLMGCTGFPYETEDAEIPEDKYVNAYVSHHDDPDEMKTIYHVTAKQIDALIQYIAVKCKRYGIDPEAVYEDVNWGAAYEDSQIRCVHGENELYPAMSLSPGLDMCEIVQAAVERMKTL